MAFKAGFIIAKIEYSESVNEMILKSANLCLHQHGIAIDSIVPFAEYDENTTSKHINRSVRVTKKTLTEQEAEDTQVITIDSGKYRQFEKYADSKYAFFSASGISVGDKTPTPHTIIWFSFNSVLLKTIKLMDEFVFHLAEKISKLHRINCMVMYATSLSRRADMFTIFVNGMARNKLAGKSALTDVRTQYGIDINTCMENVDKNLAIFHAPYDYKRIKEEIKSTKNTSKQMYKNRNKAENVVIDKVDGENMNDTFNEENNEVIKHMVERYNMVKKSLLADPIGSVVFFKMQPYAPANKVLLPENEVLFGKNTRISTTKI